ncbi:MAG: DNA replication and repair protein RecF [Chitinophagales bacterium]|nr:DNA replication and repair protein RecF [Chitinophagales bacterium]
MPANENSVFLRKLTLTNFKNHTKRDFRLSKKFTAFVGQNGVGKTNLLDLIYFLSLTKSFFNLTDQQLIKWNEAFSRIEAAIEKKGELLELVVKIPLNKRKEISVNGAVYQKAAEYIGTIPLVIISPEDSDIIQGGSEERRKLFDNILAQVDTAYLEALMDYNKILEQRNSLLKMKADKPATDISMLEFYNSRLAESGSYIFNKRKDIFLRFEAVFQQFYAIISEEKEDVKWHYASQLLSKDWNMLFEQNLQKDLVLQRTSAGIHRDDFEFTIHGEKIKKFGSQGQQKSFTIALKLSLYRYLHEMKGVLPILLIDDLFDKLDTKRMQQLIRILQGDEFGQVFMSDTDILRLEKAFDGNREQIEIFTIDLESNDTV